MPRFGGEIRDCFFLPADEPAAAAASWSSTSWPSACRAATASSPGEVQVLSPMHRGEAGVGALNTLLQERLNPWRDGMPEARGGGRAYRPGDRVLQLRNDYDLKVFNGDLGTVRAVDPTEQELLLELDDGREVRYPYASLFALTHAYAISVHKAQGAEFPAVVIPLLTSHAPMLGRTLLYTALTRARQLVVIVGPEEGAVPGRPRLAAGRPPHGAGRPAGRHAALRLGSSPGRRRGRHRRALRCLGGAGGGRRGVVPIYARGISRRDCSRVECPRSATGLAKRDKPPDGQKDG